VGSGLASLKKREVRSVLGRCEYVCAQASDRAGRFGGGRCALLCCAVGATNKMATCMGSPFPIL
jgi:hypothetical protein